MRIPSKKKRRGFNPITGVGEEKISNYGEEFADSAVIDPKIQINRKLNLAIQSYETVNRWTWSMTSHISYLLDTNILSNLAKERPEPDLICWLDEVDIDTIAMPISVAFEVQLGLEMVRSRSPQRADALEDWFENLLKIGIRVAAPGIAAARLRGRMYATPALKHFYQSPPGANRMNTGEDLFIAAMAISIGATVVTFDVEDFLQIHEHFPLPGLFDPRGYRWVVGNKTAISDPYGE